MTVLLCSCSKHDYRSSIPSGSTLLASINLADKDAASDIGFVTNLLKLDNPQACGIDISKKLYFFETADGNFGFCAKVADEDAISTYSGTLIKEGLMKKGPERDDCSFGIIADKFVAGWDDESFLIIGPVLPAAQKDFIQQIATLLKQDEEDSMNGTPLMERLDMQKGSMAMVALATALPKQVSSIFAIGAPKDADPSQIAFAADFDIRDNMLVIDAEPFSENNAIDEYLKKSYGNFRQIGDSYLKSMSETDFMGFYLNTDGKKFLPMLQQAESFQAMLAGVNQAIDMNAIIKSINGDMFISMPELNIDHPSLSIAAKLGTSAFLNDVDYWKKSAPQGCTITDWKQNAYCFHSDDMNFYFGVYNYTPMQFFAGTTQQSAEQVIAESKAPIAPEVVQTIKGKRMAMVLSLSSLLPADGGMTTLMLPSLMKAKYIVYTVK